ncbi:hypothetical protein RHSIM_RhsimUnG0073400 [Rhododendron simsii]|uniref:Retrotransposon Copia-like N-terminal domain-containing protein n=1 Tax=Rhododendron simsii TaxID=118357 RepID=A0A834FZ02_RHOSS|nr:hypothetical protein RHSIM_RhsimUnG0073400 [Rhododendron simsii]
MTTPVTSQVTTPQAAEYLPASLTFLIANFQSFITIKLESSNYFAWKSQVENALKATSLFAFADGSYEIPPPETQDTSGNTIPNPNFVRWQTIDRMLLSCLMATLTPSILPHVVGSHHTFQIWTKLEEKFSVLSRTHILDLKKRLYSLKKTTSMEKYLDSVKEIVQKLEASGSVMDDGEIVFHTINGLPEEKYLSLKQTIRTQCATTSLSFSAVSAMLMSEDFYLDDSHDTPSSTILLAQLHGSGSQGVPTVVQPSASSQIGSQAGPFQYPIQFGAQAPQFGSSSSQIPIFNPPNFGHNNFGGNRFNRNQNRPKGGPSFFKNAFPMDFPFPIGSCQICGRFNHQASTCYYRQNLGYRPPSFGYSTQVPSHGHGFSQSDHFLGQGFSPSPGQGSHGFQSSFGQGFQSPRPQALMLSGNSIPPYISGPLYPSPQGYGSYGSGYPSGFASEPNPLPWFNGSSGQQGSGSGFYGGPPPSSSPWYFDSGATSHLKLSQLHQLIQLC